MARGSDGASLAVCASEQPGLYGADTAAPGAVGWWSRAVGDLIWLHRACDLMDRDDAMPLDVPALARTAFMSTGHCSRSVRAAFGETPSSYLLMRRIERAKALLRRGTFG